MTERPPFDLDAALAALGRDERESHPAVSESLRARVLADAAAVAAGRVSIGIASAPKAVPARRIRLLGRFDVWAGAAVAAVVLCLVIGLGVGYEAGRQVLATAGLDGAELALAADDVDGTLLWEDVL